MSVYSDHVDYLSYNDHVDYLIFNIYYKELGE